MTDTQGLDPTVHPKWLLAMAGKELRFRECYGKEATYHWYYIPMLRKPPIKPRGTRKTSRIRRHSTCVNNIVPIEFKDPYADSVAKYL